MTDVMKGTSNNVLSALAVANGTAADNHDRLVYFRRLSDEYVGVRTTGVQVLVASIAVAGAAGLLGVAAGLANSKSCAPCTGVSVLCRWHDHLFGML